MEKSLVTLKDPETGWLQFSVTMLGTRGPQSGAFRVLKEVGFKLEFRVQWK